MISTCYLSETPNVSEFLASCATAVFEGKNGKTEQKTNTYVEARETDIKSGVMNHTFFGYWSSFGYEDRKVRSFFGLRNRKRRDFFRNLFWSVWDCETKKPAKKF